MIYTLIFRCFSICSHWTDFHSKLSFLKDLLLKNGYLASLLTNSLKDFRIKRHQISTFFKENSELVLPFLREQPLQNTTKLHKALKRMLGCCKINIIFKSKQISRILFHFKDCLSYDLIYCVVYKFQRGRCSSSHYGKTDRYLKVRSDSYIGISPLTFNKVKPSVKSSISNHLVFCYHSHDFIILAHVTNKFLSEIKESLLITCDK